MNKISKHGLFVFFLAFVLLFSFSCSHKKSTQIKSLQKDNNWHVYALSYAFSKDLPMKQLIKGSNENKEIDMSWYFYVALGFNKIVLIDAGTDAFLDLQSKASKKWKVIKSKSFIDTLKNVGLEVKDITDVLITHNHFDHVGGIRYLDHANIYMHQGELKLLRKRADKGLLMALDKINTNGQMHVFKKTPMHVFDNMTIIEKGRHTDHHCMIEIKCEDKNITIAGDEYYFYKDITEAQGNIIPGHDPKVANQFEICP